jgi:hypothetical protein
MKFPGLPSVRFIFLVVPFILFALGSHTLAQDSANHGTAAGLQAAAGQEHIQVVGHLDLNGMHVNQMFIEQRGDKVYLFLHRPTKQAYALVDVTKPDHPMLVSRDVAKSDGRTEGPATGSVFALTVTPENASASTSAAPLPTETVNLVDLSDPKKVKTVKTFKGVTAVYPEDGRKLVYLVNNEGLWIVNHRMTHPLPVCDSESALTPEPECQ